MNSEITVTEVNKANQLQQEGKLEEAIAVYRGLTEKLYQQLGKLLSQQKNWNEAIATYRRSLELNPQDYECHYQLGEAIYQWVMENPETFFSEYNLAEVTHKDYQVFDPELPAVCFLNDQAFLQATSHLDDATYTVEWYKVYLRRSLSEAEKQGCINWLQTPGHSRELGIKVWREGLAEFQTLLKRSYMTVGLEEAVNCYRRAIELYPYHHPLYKGLVEALTTQGKHEEAITIYHQLGLYLAEANRMDEAIACFQNIPKILLRNNQKTYDLIWDGLNELRPLDTVNLYYSSEISQNSAYEYFVNSSQYTVVNLWNLNDSDRSLLENLGLSIENLGLIKQENIGLEEIYINSFDDHQGFQLSRKVKRHPKMSRYFQWDKAINLQQSIVETGFVYSVCPFTGKILRSNQSFYVEPFILYRFVGKEVFYLMYGDWMGTKQCIYLPNQELIIVLDNFPGGNFTGVINLFKSYVLSNWQQFKAYLYQEKKGVCAVLGIAYNVGHYVWNECSGIYYLYKNGTLNNIDKFLVGSHEYIMVDDIFPSIPSDKIIRLDSCCTEVIFKNIIENNLFAVRLTDTFIEEELAKKIYQSSVEKCSQDFLEKVEMAKNHFPLLWITLRNYKRTWFSQIEGTANIIKSLHTNFPNLAVVFDGWSVPERDHENASNETHIEALEQDCLQPILNLLPHEITTYSTIGHPIYETIIWAEAIDLYAVPFGTGMTFVTWIASKPGVGHGNKAYSDAVEDSFSPVYRENAVLPVLISKEYITEDENNPDAMTRNYDCDWQVIYNELMQILQNLPKRV
ncbi:MULTISPECIES: tetratricopeptide repeat protein [unclassified Microcoleus]|uniref:tetratricopeptide repeat protein n=1 Tax=unclassified Microcoleus TaxID=2642155 RepID=UPI002FD5F77C